MLKFVTATIKHSKSRILITIVLLSMLFGSLVITTKIIQESIFNDYRFINDTNSDYWAIKHPLTITNQPIFFKNKTDMLIQEVSKYAKITPLYIIGGQMISSSQEDTSYQQPVIVNLYRMVGAFSNVDHSSAEIREFTHHETSNHLIAVLAIDNNNFHALGINVPKDLDTSSPYVLAPLIQRDTDLDYGKNTIQILKHKIPIEVNNKKINVTGTYSIAHPPLFAISTFITNDIELVTNRTSEESPPYTHLIIKLYDKYKSKELIDSIHKYFPDANILTKRQYATNTIRISLVQIDTRSLFFAGIIILLTAIIITSTTFQIFIRDQRNIYSMLKALGTKSSSLFLVTVIEIYVISLIAAILGLLIGFTTYFTVLKGSNSYHDISTKFMLLYTLMVTIIASISLIIPSKELSKISADSIFIENQYE